MGQPDFDSSETGCSDTRLSNGGHDVLIVEGRLIVADTGNDRVLIWNDVPTAEETPADLVLGQDDMTSCGSGTAANRLDEPVGLWSDGNRLAVAEGGNHRVLLWNSFPTSSGQDADVVLGQPDMDSGTDQGQAQDTMSFPYFVASNGNQLFVAACGTRVLIWDAFPTEHGAPADRVLGEEDFVSDSSTTSRTQMQCPSGMLLHGRELFVAEYGSHRLSVFEAP